MDTDQEKRSDFAAIVSGTPNAGRLDRIGGDGSVRDHQVIDFPAGNTPLVDQNQTSIGEYEEVSNDLEGNLHRFFWQEDAVELLPSLFWREVARMTKQAA